MIKAQPAIYGLSIENIKQKIDFYDYINMRELAINDPKKLMQSVILSYARCKFYTEELGIEVNMSNCSKLFIGQKRFEEQYGITKSQLLEKYNYLAVSKSIGGLK